VRVWPEEVPGPSVARLPASGETPVVEAEQRSPCKGASNWSGLQRQRSPSKRRQLPAARRINREPSLLERVKATESTSDPGAGAQELSGVGGVERPKGCPGNWRGPPRPRGGRWPQARTVCGPTCGGNVPKEGDRLTMGLPGRRAELRTIDPPGGTGSKPRP
jgi:hypothetical protein